MSGESVIKVLVVDDHELAREGTSKLLEGLQEFVVLANAESGEAAVDMVRHLRPDVVLMDILMPGIGGLEATRRCIRAHPMVKVVAVTMYDDEPYPTRLLGAGASGYLTKNASLEELVLAIKKVYEGQRYISAQVAQQIALRPYQRANAGPFDDLSAREMQITLMVIMGHKALDISEKLSLSPKTINSYRYRIFGKMGVRNDVELTKLAIKHGVIDSDAAA